MLDNCSKFSAMPTLRGIGASCQQMLALSLLFLLFSARLFLMIVMPLNDKTEARYADIARLMVEQDNWVTLFQAPNDPFWAKPPLSTWTSAFSMKFFGLQAWSARLPALLFAIGVLYLTGYLAQKRYNESFKWYVLLILASSPYFFINAGVVMTDPALVFSVTLCMVSAWMALYSSHYGLLTIRATEHRCDGGFRSIVNKPYSFLTQKIWGYGFFVGLGLGLLAKGPLVGVLVILPLILWSFYQRTYASLWQQLPWIKGSFLTLVIALPWYISAEMRTPGFLNYFIIGEHFQRFFNSGWQGDKYGFAHATARGMIWIYLLGGILPWLIMVLSGLNLKKKSVDPIPPVSIEDKHWLSYLCYFAFTPLVFFSFSGNIIYTYTFTALPALALLVLEGIKRQIFSISVKGYTAVIAIFVCGIFIISGIFIYKPEWIAKSQDRVIQVWKNQNSHLPLIYWSLQPDYSARFYSRGQVIGVRNASELTALLQDHQTHYIAIHARELQEIPASLRQKWTKIAAINIQKNQMILFKSCITPLN